MAPDLYKIASRKMRLVSKELDNNNSVTTVSCLNSMKQFQDFLWIASILAEVTLDPLQPDTISWIWTSGGCYSAKSAYRTQFIGAFPSFSTSKVWKADAEPKCTMFSWLALHRKVLTADRLAVRGWSHDPIFQLCQRACHLCKDCPFTAQVWNLVHAWSLHLCT
jgi:hypothetical protein